MTNNRQSIARFVITHDSPRRGKDDISGAAEVKELLCVFATLRETAVFLREVGRSRKDAKTQRTPRV
jgi:hypothetical protein